MGIGYQVGSDDILRDSRGREVGRVDHFGQVKQGWQDRGRITDNGRYVDEYNRDLGWATRAMGSDSGAEAIAPGIGLLVVGVVALVQWLRQRKQEGAAATRNQARASSQKFAWAPPLPESSVEVRVAPDVNLSLVFVPAGPFLMGNERRSAWVFPKDFEAPEHYVNLPGYWMCRYPVTVQQFRAFVELSGYQTDLAEIIAADDKPDWPVRNVSWPEAVAFCVWASASSGHLFRLPTEAEWEKAARGTDGRLYPWGDDYEYGAHCNGGHGRSGWPSPVGMFSPHGDSPYGCADMAGNVAEWTSSRCQRYPYRPDDGREDPTPYAHGVREVRGGSYHNNNPGNVSVVVRDGFGEISGGRWETVGFRCVCAR